MYTTPDVQNDMDVVSVGNQKAGTITFFLSDMPHQGPGPVDEQIEESSKTGDHTPSTRG
jgi:hypothetical protein